MSATTVLARKWRPRRFDELAGQEHVVRALGNALMQNRLHHAYLFTGTRGVGKTTIARIFAKSLNCENGVTATPCGQCRACTEIDAGRFVDLVELDAASNTQVDSMRELLEGALYAPSNARFKIYIIDEVHMLSKSAFNAMLKTLEEPPGHVKFILATTDPQKIPVTVLSRCLQFNLKQLPVKLITERLQYVLEQEGLTFEPAALVQVAKAAEGSMRDALSLMDQAIAFSAGKVEAETVSAMLGTIDQRYLHELLHAMAAQDGPALMHIADSLCERSIDLEAALQSLAALLHRVALVQTVPEAVSEEDPERAALAEFAALFSPESLQLYYQIAIHGRNELELAPDEYAGFTMALMRMLAFAPGQLQGPGATGTKGGGAPAQRDAVARAETVVPSSARVAAEAEVPRKAVSRLVATEAGTSDWAEILPHLNLQAMAQQLAMHCTLVQCAGDTVTLSLDPSQKHLQARSMAVEKLQAALAEYFRRPMRLLWHAGAVQTATATPAAQAQQRKEESQREAEARIAGDGFVRDAQAQLDAKLVDGSIRSH